MDSWKRGAPRRILIAGIPNLLLEQKVGESRTDRSFGHKLARTLEPFLDRNYRITMWIFMDTVEYPSWNRGWHLYRDGYTSYAAPIRQKAKTRRRFVFIIDFCSNEIFHGEIEQKFERETNLFWIRRFGSRSIITLRSFRSLKRNR